jgi:hypothetical protein
MAVTRRKLGGWLNLLVSGLLALAAWGLATVLATQPALKRLWDFSPQARFSVETATAELLEQVRARGTQVEIHTLFYPLGGIRPATAEQRQQLAIQQRLQDLTRDLLRQYAYLGGEAVRVTHHDLLRDPGRIREVMREIQNRRYNSVIIKVGKRSKVLSLDIDMAELDLPRSPLPQGMPGAARRVPTLKDYKGEEAISTALKRLLVEGTPKLYFLSGYSAMALEGIGPSYSEMLAALAADGFEIAFLDIDKQRHIPEDAAAVALVTPTRELLPGAAELLYQYVREGGRLFVNLHWYEQPEDWNISLAALGERFGFEFSDDLVCHLLQDPANRRHLTSGRPMCQNLDAVNMNPTHPVTRPLVGQQRYPSFKLGREIRAVGSGAAEGVRVDTSFVRTGPGAWLERRPLDWIGPPPSPDSYQIRSIGAVVDVDTDEPGRTGHVVLIAAKGFVNTSWSINGDLALNIFNWMAEREALVSIRGQRYVSRKLELEPSQLSRIGWLLIGGVPGFLLALGLLVFWRRSRT